jgi:hypothetical protein
MLSTQVEKQSFTKIAKEYAFNQDTNILLTLKSTDSTVLFFDTDKGILLREETFKNSVSVYLENKKKEQEDVAALVT